MGDKTYWAVRIEAFAFATEAEADDYRTKAEDMLIDMPESAGVSFVTTIVEEPQQ